MHTYIMHAYIYNAYIHAHTTHARARVIYIYVYKITSNITKM